MEAWKDFKGIKWQKNIDVLNFIEMNYQEYKEDVSFLSPISKKTSKIWKKCDSLIKKEDISGVLDIETDIITGIDNFEPGYIDRKNEVIFGLQTDEPLKRSINLYSGLESTKNAIESFGFRLDSDIKNKFKEYTRTYSDAIKDVYSDEIKKCIDSNLIKGLPDNYKRGKIIGDYRRIPLYGTSVLKIKKEEDIKKLSQNINSTTIRLIEELKMQINALNELEKMAERYEFDISLPAKTAKEAVQWLYFTFLACTKQDDASEMSLGKNSAFLDIYIERDIKNGLLTEEEAQELIDQLIVKISLIRQLRNIDYYQIYAGDSCIITESLGGMINDEKSFVTKTSYRFLNSINNLGTNIGLNFSILWSNKLPDNFKNYVVDLNLKVNCISFVNDDITRKIFGNDYAVNSGSSVSMIGKQVMFNGSSINFPKLLLYSLNGGRDEVTNELIVDGIELINSEYLDYEIVFKNLEKVMKKVIEIYASSLNIIHYMQDKYSYESMIMACQDTLVSRVMIFSVTGLSTIADSLSAIKYGKVRVTRNEQGLTDSFDVNVDYPVYGTNDQRADEIVNKIVSKFYQILKKQNLYRNSEPILSLSSDSLNVLYGTNTGATPDGRKKKQPFSVDANPTPGNDNNGILTTLSSMAKIPYKVCLGGINNQIFVSNNSLGETKVSNLVHILDGYFKQGGNHLTVNIIDKTTFIDAYNTPSKCPNLIIAISGYSARFNKLTKEQKEEALKRTIHENL